MSWADGKHICCMRWRQTFACCIASLGRPLGPAKLTRTTIEDSREKSNSCSKRVRVMLLESRVLQHALWSGATHVHQVNAMLVPQSEIYQRGSAEWPPSTARQPEPSAVNRKRVNKPVWARSA